MPDAGLHGHDQAHRADGTFDVLLSGVSEVVLTGIFSRTRSAHRREDRKPLSRAQERARTSGGDPGPSKLIFDPYFWPASWIVARCARTSGTRLQSCVFRSHQASKFLRSPWLRNHSGRNQRQGWRHPPQPAAGAECAQRRTDGGTARAIGAFEADANISCMVLTGSDKAFAAGADIKEMANKSFLDAFMGRFRRRLGSRRPGAQADHCRGRRLCARRRL